MRTMDDLLAAHPFFSGLSEEWIGVLAGCAHNEHIGAGELFLREGGSADYLYVVRHGRVALELYSPAAGPLVLDTVDDGGVVGWEWLVPPHRWVGDARAVEPTDLIAFDGTCLRRKCDSDPRLGYELLRRVADVMYHRLLATRVRLIDIYGTSHVAAH